MKDVFFFPKIRSLHAKFYVRNDGANICEKEYSGSSWNIDEVLVMDDNEAGFFFFFLLES